MNILFYTYNKVQATRGGTERATTTVATALTKYYSCRCFSVYEISNDSNKEECFIDEYQWHVNRDRNLDLSWLDKIITNNKIDVIIIQGAFIYVGLFTEAAKKTGSKVILAHHFEPGAEKLFFNFAKAIKDRPEAEASFRKKCVWAGNIILFPIIRLLHIHSLRKSYQQAYRYADKVVLLSQSFIPQFQKFGRINDASKFVIIPNGLSFDKFVNKKEIDAKKNIALIVSRLDETHKRLSLAFKIWKNVQSQIPEDWELIVVGDGKDYNKYQKFIKHNHIDNVIMVGRKDPVPYYKSASVFVMTSRSESWGLTLTEAQQFGVVPIAFNAYSSLSDIIENSKNGIIVPECDIASYEKQLLNLINNKLERTKLAVNAVESSRQFSKDIIVQKWWNLLNSIIA